MYYFRNIKKVTVNLVFDNSTLILIKHTHFLAVIICHHADCSGIFFLPPLSSPASDFRVNFCLCGEAEPRLLRSIRLFLL